MKYRLENDYLTVAFDSLGGSLTSIQNKEGLEYLWQGDSVYWSGQAPVLFPICGSLRNNRAQTLDGKTITMPRHGIIRKLEFACEKVTSTEIMFSIESNAELRQQYPFYFTFFIQYQLVDSHVIVQYAILNCSDETMPYFVGGHPGFNCPLEANLDFADYQVHFEKEEPTELPNNQLETGLVDRINKRSLDFNGRNLSLSHDLFKQDALIFANSQSKRARLSSPKGQHGVEISFDDFAHLLVWSTANDGPFVALEPMQGLSTYLDESDIFEEKEHVQTLEPNELAFYRYQLRFF